MRVVLNMATAGLESRGKPVVQGMTHYDIATLAGTSRETASRVISQLTREGIVTPEGRRLNVDLTRLSERLERP
jgi:CRP-like cAMP-binding protein